MKSYPPEAIQALAEFRMTAGLKSGDVVMITELTRLSRSVKDLFEIAELIHT
jgi:DNA invertase Pin-like site-specific DNA recombinase